MTDEIIIVDENSIKDKIYTIRGQKVMIDSDLAKIYGYAENDVDVATLQAYAGVDIIAEDMEAHGQYRILRRFLREGDTLLVNLSESFRGEIQAQGQEQETLICYSMVNTLCKNTGLRRVRFFFEGRQEEYVAGSIYWAGEFMYNIGLVEKGLG